MGSLSHYVLQITLTLLIFGGVALVLVRLGRRSGPSRSGPLALVARLHLEGRRVVYLVQVGSRWLVLGGSEAGLTRLGELDAEPFPTDSAPAPSETEVEQAPER